MSSQELTEFFINSLNHLGSVVSVMLNGHYFDGADIAVESEAGKPDYFRFIVVPIDANRKVCKKKIL